MERLTKRGTTSQNDIDELLELSNENQLGRNNAYFKLQEYEDMEENNNLLKLPCKVGDTIYVIGVLGCETIEEYKVIRVDYHSTLSGKNEFYIEAFLKSNPNADIAFYDKEIKRTVFFSKSEAEKKLKEIIN